MKQITYFILLLSFIVYISTETCVGISDPSKKKCTSHDMTNETGDMCCYVKGKGQSMCVALLNSTYESYKETIKAAGGSINCNSNWLNLGFSLVLLILFL